MSIKRDALRNLIRAKLRNEADPKLAAAVYGNVSDLKMDQLYEVASSLRITLQDTLEEVERLHRQVLANYRRSSRVNRTRGASRAGQRAPYV